MNGAYTQEAAGKATSVDSAPFTLPHLLGCRLLTPGAAADGRRRRQRQSAPLRVTMGMVRWSATPSRYPAGCLPVEQDGPHYMPARGQWTPGSSQSWSRVTKDCQPVSPRERLTLMQQSAGLTSSSLDFLAKMVPLLT